MMLWSKTEIWTEDTIQTLYLSRGKSYGAVVVWAGWILTRLGYGNKDTITERSWDNTVSNHCSEQLRKSNTENIFSMDEVIGGEDWAIILAVFKLRDSITNGLLGDKNRREGRGVNRFLNTVLKIGSGLCIRVRVEKWLELDAKILDISISLLLPSTTLDEDMVPLEDFESFLTCFQNSCGLRCERAVARFLRWMWFWRRRIRRCMKTCSLQARTAKWAFCNKTTWRFTFLGSPFP